jgi:hypothetical protein
VVFMRKIGGKLQPTLPFWALNSAIKRSGRRPWYSIVYGCGFHIEKWVQDCSQIGTVLGIFKKAQRNLNENRRHSSCSKFHLLEAAMNRLCLTASSLGEQLAIL